MRSLDAVTGFSIGKNFESERSMSRLSSRAEYDNTLGEIQAVLADAIQGATMFATATVAKANQPVFSEPPSPSPQAQGRPFDVSLDSAWMDVENRAGMKEIRFLPSLSGAEARSQTSSGVAPIDASANLTYSNYIAGAAGGYNIELVFVGSEWTQILYDEAKAMANLVCKLITGDLSNVSLTTTSRINGRRTTTTEFIDDIKIEMTLKAIDGVDGVLGSAGPSVVRTNTSEYYLPCKASITFDVADATSYQGKGLFDDISFHEMLHCVGLGSVWPNKNLINSTANTFVGQEANDAYALSGFGARGTLLIEDDGGSGTAKSHWEEGSDRTAMNPTGYTAGSEIMTGFINPTNWLSYVTVASLEDMKYDTPWDSSRSTDLLNPVLMSEITPSNADNFVYGA